MKSKLSSDALAQLFSDGHTAHAFVPHTISDSDIHALYETMKWAPTAFNASPARFVFLRSAAALTVIVAFDTQFYEHLPQLFPAYDAKPIYANNAAAAQEAAFRNGSLQGAYLLMAARALGYDCGPMSGFDAAKVNAEFFPKGDWKVNFLMNIGVADPKGIYPRNIRLDFDRVASIL
jgi:nitroreductase